MPKLIQDEFTNKRISRQKRYQLRKKKAGVCQVCGRESEGRLCPEHEEAARIARKEYREKMKNLPEYV